MIETKIGGIEFSTDAKTLDNPWVIAPFGPENAGKTRLALTGPSGVGWVPLEMKTYKTLEKDAQALGKAIFKPKNPEEFMVPMRQVMGLSAVEQQLWYKGHVNRILDWTYGLLEHPDVRIVCIDKFTSLCAFIEFKVNGTEDKVIKIDGKVYKPRAEFNQACQDFITSLAKYKKPVILNCADKDDYEVLYNDKPFRKTWEAYKYLGSHANCVVEMTKNRVWDEAKGKVSQQAWDKYGWKYKMNVRTCQTRPELEGIEGNPLLFDDDITLSNLVYNIDPDNYNPDEWT